MRVLCRRTNKEYTKYCLAYSLFQSTSSVWRTTQIDRAQGIASTISIHVLRVEDDRADRRALRQRLYFNPRPPCGGRPYIGQTNTLTLPISIHVLRVEDDLVHKSQNRRIRDFNPRPPCGGRRLSDDAGPRRRKISIHVLHVEDDGRRNPDRQDGLRISIHVLHVEDDPRETEEAIEHDYFNPRPPCGGRHRQEEKG